MLEKTASFWTRNEILEDFWELVYSCVDRFANKDFITTTSGSITFSQANNLSNIIQQVISSESKESKFGVGLFLQDPLKIVPGMLGVMKTRNYFIVMDTTYPEATLNHMIETAEIKLILTDNEYFERIKSITGDNVVIIDLDKLDDQYLVPNPVIKYSPDDVLQIIFTSGSTGRPKGVIEDYRYLTRAIYIKQVDYAFTEADRTIQLSSYTFGGPHTATFAALLIGFSIYIYNVKTDGFIGLKDWIQEKEITFLKATPTVFRNLVSGLDPDDKFFSVHTLHLGGEKRLQEDLPIIRRHFPNVKNFRLGFASSETQAVSIFTFTLDHKFEGDVLPSGRPLEDIKVYIWDTHENELQSGEAGEIVVYGDSLARGYMNNPELTKERFIPDPNKPLFQYFKTGDLGKILPDGQLMHMGRIDSMVKIKGVRIELSSIENHMLSYPGIAQAALRAIEISNTNIKLAAYFTADPEIQIPISDLRKHLADELPQHMLPHFLIAIDHLPTTSTGKIDPNLLPIPDMVRPNLDNSYQPAEDDLEKTLVDIWEELIGIQGIGVNDDFFDVGGDSLIGVLLFIRIEEVLGRDLPVSILLTASTIREQAKIIRNKDVSDDFKPVIPININGENPPLFFIPGKGGYPTRIRHLAKKMDPNTPVYALQDLMENNRKRNSIQKYAATAAFYIKQIKKLYPYGPYYLVGESLGGTLALEMAQQLMEIGDQIPILVMLDTYNMKGRALTNYKGSANKTKYYNMLINKHYKIMRDSDWAGRWDYLKFYRETLGKKLFKFLKIKIIKRKNQPETRISEKVKRIEDANRKAELEYNPKYYPGKVIFFKALLGPIPEEPTNGWNIDNFGEFVVHNLNSYHGSILFEPVVSQVAKNIQDHIDLESKQTE